ncbi:MAG: LysR family transcriptional regulator [Pseudomonadota bacterium]
MRFRSFDSLNIFRTVAEKMSFTAAGDALNMSKGAVSYQIAKLEAELGTNLFERRHTRIRLTAEGQRLNDAATRHLGRLEAVIAETRSNHEHPLCVGAHSWFIARWLGPRLSQFTSANPDISLRVEPINTEADLNSPALDLSVFWCDPDVTDLDVEVLFRSETRPLASPDTAARVERLGLRTAVREIPLLPDASGMTAWRDWHDRAGLPFAPTRNALSLPDANSRLQAVMSGNGLGLQDEFAAPEIESGRLVWISERALTNFAYCILPPAGGHLSTPAALFKDWLTSQDF